VASASKAGPSSGCSVAIDATLPLARTLNGDRVRALPPHSGPCGLSSHFTPRRFRLLQSSCDCCGGSQHTLIIHRITVWQLASESDSQTTLKLSTSAHHGNPKRPQRVSGVSASQHVIICTKQSGERLNEPQPTFPGTEDVTGYGTF
jgi:hypothetical protein